MLNINTGVKRFVKLAIKDIILMEIINVFSFQLIVKLLIKMETVLIVQMAIMKSMVYAILQSRFLQMITALNMDMLIFIKNGTPSTKKDVKKFVKSVMKDFTQIKIINVYNYQLIAMPLIRMETVLIVLMAIDQQMVYVILLFQPHHQIIVLDMHTLMQIIIIMANFSKDARKSVSSVTKDFILMLAINVKF